MLLRWGKHIYELQVLIKRWYVTHKNILQHWCWQCIIFHSKCYFPSLWLETECLPLGERNTINMYASNVECSSGNHLSISHLCWAFIWFFREKFDSELPWVGMYQWDWSNVAFALLRGTKEHKIIGIHEVPRSIKSIESLHSASRPNDKKTKNTHIIISRKREANFRKKVYCMHQWVLHINVYYYCYSLVHAETKLNLLFRISDAVCNRAYPCRIIFLETREPKDRSE